MIPNWKKTLVFNHINYEEGATTTIEGNVGHNIVFPNGESYRGDRNKGGVDCKGMSRWLLELNGISNSQIIFFNITRVKWNLKFKLLMHIQFNLKTNKLLIILIINIHAIHFINQSISTLS